MISDARLSRIENAAGLKRPIRHQLFIGGKFVPAADGATLPTLNPHDNNSPIADVATAGREDVDRAVAAATAAQPAWARLSASERGRLLLKLADRIEESAEELARLESLDTGHPLRESRSLDVPRTALCFRYFGGKGANIVFEDADLAAAVNGSAFAIFHNQGQACIAGSRLMLHERIAAEFLERFIALGKSIRLGNPLDPLTELGPLTSVQHRDRVLRYVDHAREEGGRVLLGGTPPEDPSLALGCYVQPTVVPRNGIRGDARVHAGKVRLGERRRANPAVVSTIGAE